MKLQLGKDLAPDEGLSRPASVVTGGRSQVGDDVGPTCLSGTATRVRRERLVTDIARSHREPLGAQAPDMFPVAPTTRERAIGVTRETYRTRGVTHFRAVRTLDMGDEPIPTLAYYTDGSPKKPTRTVTTPADAIDRRAERAAKAARELAEFDSKNAEKFGSPR